jgi:hypothetical protein
VNINRYCLFPSITNWQTILEFGKKTYFTSSLLIADFFRGIDKLFFSFPLENGVLSRFYPFTYTEGDRGYVQPFRRKNFYPVNKKQPKTLYLWAFSAEKIFLKFFKTDRKMSENLL